ncbi:MAG: DUF3341 domain-containing protein [Chitinophagaceae bacterium]|nr:DUF3341 domain-containing protein [Chitinophagaceae bacterium]
MTIKKFVVGSFDDEDVLFPAVRNVRKAGYKIQDVYTPFPVHGLDKELGMRETRLHTAGFIYALCGLITALGFISWILTMDWVQNYGGKPHFSLLAWIPIMFELTVLFSGVGMTLTFCYLCQLAPFVKKHHFSPRATDDLFVMVIECTPHTDIREAESFLAAAGAKDVNVQNAEVGWWFGRYDMDRKLFDQNAEVVTA